MGLFFSFLSFCFGTIIGSFLNVVIWRLPREQSLGGRSQCPGCGHQLSAPDLLPLFSFLCLRGRCRHCAGKISSRYFFVELLTGALFLATWLVFSPAVPAAYGEAVRALFIVAVMITVFAIDFEHYLILDKVVFPAAAILLISNLLLDFVSKQAIWQPASHTAGGLIGALVLSLPFFLLWYFSKGHWLGFGDVKLALLLGVALGWPGTIIAFFFAIFSGTVISLILMLFAGKSLTSRVPFGTFLAAGSVLALWFGSQALQWYLGLLGF